MPISRRSLLGVLLVPFVTGCGSRDSDPSSSESPAADTTEQSDSGSENGASGRGNGATAIGRTDGDGSTGESSPVGTVTVVNAAAEDRYVTVAVESAGETQFVESRTVHGGTAVTYDGIVPSPGPYRIVVDTDAGSRGTFDWRVTGTLPALQVRLTDGIGFSRPVVCDPDCPGVALGGTSTGYPEGGFDPRGRRAGPELRVHNAGDGSSVVRVRVADGAVLDYQYRLPPTATLTVPVPQRAGETAVRIDVGGDPTHAFGWAMEANPVRRVAVGRSD